MVCVVLRANPPFDVFEGLIKRLWGKLGIERVARMNAGYTIVKFHDVSTRDMVLESGVVHFDRKPVLLRPWSTDLDTLRFVKSVPVWIRLPDLGLQYWSTKCLSALVSTIGKHMMIDKAIEFEWMPSRCSHCKSFGHLGSSCKRDQGSIWRKKETKPGLGNVEAESNQATTSTVSEIFPKDPHDLVIGTEMDHTKKSGRTNKYNVLQESQMEVTKKGQQEINGFNGRVQRAFLETKLRGNKIEEMMRSVFVGWDCFNSPVVEGRILMVWKTSQVSLSILQEVEQYVHCCVKIKGITQKFCLSLVYGRNSVEERKSLWTQLSSLEFPVHPWLEVGDFNAVFDYDDQIGGHPVTEMELEDGHHWRVCTMVDEFRSIGSHYTRSNKQVEGARIFSKLDRVFKNEACIDTFPDSEARFNWDVISDHCYYIIKTIPVQIFFGIKMKAKKAVNTCRWRESKGAALGPMLGEYSDGEIL
ncbi:uncharacterized protein LOC133831920 [Humulus lupulus]|uniref:uncharacterized protein LOC133831920 n=1 Tax=Humulus lupulus TaxID=3486 RepID=UPI002B416E47|nr:uncharacterized protein LOC133831920 [Humulus lupulus]